MGEYNVSMGVKVQCMLLAVTLFHGGIIPAMNKKINQTAAASSAAQATLGLFYKPVSV